LRYIEQVVSQLEPFDHAVKEWNKVRSKGILNPDSPEAATLLEGLTTLNTSSRLGKVVASWSDASPYSDAEAILDAEAAPYRNFLNFLSSIASVLVLIGLVGNFFGLAEAAKNLPQLADVTSAKVTTNTTIDSGKPETMGQAEKSVGKEQTSSQTEASGQEMSGKILKITNGLQVVVVSSVMGIGGMIFLVIFVAYYRGVFNHLVAQETLLMGTEIGSAIRPLHGGQNASSAIAELSQGVQAIAAAIQPIPGRMENFDKVASQLAASQLEMGSVVKQLDGALKHMLTESTRSHSEYKGVLEDFKKYLVDRTESLTSLFQVSGSLGERLSEMTDRTQSIQQHFESLVASQKKNQLEYDNYAQLVRNLANEERTQFRDFSETTIREIKSTLQEAALELSKSSKENRNTLAGLSDDLKVRVESLASTLELQGGKSQESQQNLVKEIQSVHQDLQSAQTSHLEKISESFIRAQDQSTALLVSVKEQLQNYAEGMKSSSEEILRNQSQASDSLNSAFQQLMTSLGQSTEVVAGQLADSARAHQLALAGAFSQQVQEATRELGEFIQSTAAHLQQQAKASDEIRAQLSEAVHKSLNVLEEARQRMAEDADRWKTSQELSVQGLFTRWNEEFGRQNPAAAQGPSAPAVAGQGVDIKDALEQLVQTMAQMQQNVPSQQTVNSEVDQQALVATLSQANQEIGQLMESTIASLHTRVEAQEEAWAQRHAQQAQTLETLVSNLTQALAQRPSSQAAPVEVAPASATPAEVPQALQEFRAYSEAALESLRDQSESNRKWVSEVERTLEAATQTMEFAKARLQDGEDRWRTAQELSTQGLFSRWTEEFAQGGLHLPEFQQSLKRLDSCLDQFAKMGMHQVLVCAECGALAPQADGYCQACQASLTSACPQPVFLAKSWDKAQGQLDLRLASIAEAVQGLNQNLQQLEQRTPEPTPRPLDTFQPLDLSPMLDSLQGLQHELRQLRQENEQYQRQLISLAESEPAPPQQSLVVAEPEPAPQKERSSGFLGLFRLGGKK